MSAHPGIHFLWKNRSIGSGFRTGVSLHSHTLFSRESLDFIPEYAARIPILKQAVGARVSQYRRETGKDPDFSRGWWTPPLPPREAYDLEAGQITQVLNLAPLVSLTDHDNIEAALRLHLVESTSNAPVSVEWTVPFENSFLHVGVHNLPAGKAQPMMDYLASVTANPLEDEVAAALAELNRHRDVLIVLNHPLWDEKGVGIVRHQLLLERFLTLFGSWIHALELNGLRTCRENKFVLRIAQATGFPLVSGGDRHGREPNANVNLTNAATFSEFVDEVRYGKVSNILFLPQYKESRNYRVVRTICDILRHEEHHEFGWAHWSDRIFYRREDGSAASLSSVWSSSKRPPAVVRYFVGLMNLLESNPVQAALKVALLDKEEVAL